MKYDSQLSIPFQGVLSKYVPSPTLNAVAEDLYSEMESTLGDNSRILIVGCGEGGEGIEGLSSHYLENNTYGVDVRDTTFADFLGDAHRLPFKDGAFDGIVCQAMLEHVPDYQSVLTEMKRILRPGGLFYLDVPFIQGYHALPTDYHRFTLEELRNIFSDYKEISAGASKGPTSTLVWVLCEYLAYVLSFGHPNVRKGVSVFFRFALFWIKYVDQILMKSHGDAEGVLTIPSAIYWYGQKPTETRDE